LGFGLRPEILPTPADLHRDETTVEGGIEVAPRPWPFFSGTREALLVRVTGRRWCGTLMRTARLGTRVDLRGVRIRACADQPIDNLKGYSDVERCPSVYTWMGSTENNQRRAKQ
jgi:hypothetical protein